jgi:hypothetical protein
MATQTTRLPQQADVTLPSITLLTSKKDFDNWFEIVEAALEIKRMKNLINSSLPRPTEHDPDYDRWEMASKLVKFWLLSHLGSEIMSEIRLSGKTYEYADDLMQALRLVIKGHGRRLSGLVFLAATNIKREHFATIDQFIKEFKELFQESNRLNCPITPYCGAMIVLCQLEDEFRPWVEATRRSWSDGIESTMTEGYLHQICGEAVDQEATYKKTTQFIALKKTGNSNHDTQGAQTPKKKGIRNSPGKGEDIETHVAALRKRQSKDGNCAYCNRPGHGPLTCYYLVDDPPRDWKPDQYLWVYSWAKRRSQKMKQTTISQLPPPPPREETTIPASNMASRANENSSFYFNAFSAIPMNITHADKSGKVEKLVIETTDTYIGQEPSLSGSAVCHVTGEWIADTGSANNIVGCIEDFIDYHKFEPGTSGYKFKCSNGAVGHAEGTGTALMRLDLRSGEYADVFLTAYYVPDINYNLWACERAKFDQGIWYKSKDNTIRRMSDDIVIGYTKYNDGIPIVQTKDFMKPLQMGALQLAAVSPMLQHRRLAHAGDARRRRAQKNDDVEPSGPIAHCEACRLGKAKCLVSRDPMPKASKPGEIIHTDVQTIKPTGYGGYKYFVLFLDDKTHNMWVRFIKEKGDAAEASKEFARHIKITTGAYPRQWNTDGGLEFSRFNTWIKKKGTKMRISPPRTSEPNGPVERAQGYIVQTARVLMIDSGLPTYLWPFAVETAVYTIVRLIREDETTSPLQQWRELLNLPNAETTLKHVKVWGCKAYVHIPEEDRVKALKMLPRARVGRLIGYDGDHGHVYKVWMPETGEIKRSRDVTFWEDDFFWLNRQRRETCSNHIKGASCARPVWK